MNTLTKNIGKFLKIGTLWSTVGFILMVILQIFARFFLESAPSWTEEASRLFFMYAISFGAGLALKSKYYVHLDMFYNSFPKKVRKALTIIIPIATFLLFAIIAIYAVQLIILGFPEKSPSMGFRMAFAFLSILIMALGVLFYTWKEFIKVTKKLK